MFGGGRFSGGVWSEECGGRNVSRCEGGGVWFSRSEDELLLRVF